MLNTPSLDQGAVLCWRWQSQCHPYASSPNPSFLFCTMPPVSTVSVVNGLPLEVLGTVCFVSFSDSMGSLSLLWGSIAANPREFRIRFNSVYSHKSRIQFLLPTNKTLPGCSEPGAARAVPFVLHSCSLAKMSTLFDDLAPDGVINLKMGAPGKVALEKCSLMMKKAAQHRLVCVTALLLACIIYIYMCK